MAGSVQIISRAGCTAALVLVAASLAGCAKNVRLTGLPLAREGKAEVKVELTYDRNNTLTLKLSNVPDPSSLGTGYTRYVLWAESPDGARTANLGQIRITDSNNGEIQTLTPLRSFRLFITAEARGDVAAPGPDRIFESEQIDW